MTPILKDSKALRLVVVTAVAVVMGLLFANPSGAVETNDGCYPDCTTTTEQTTTTAVEETTTTTEQSTTTTEQSTTTTEQETTTTAEAKASHEDSGGGSLPVTGGDIVGMALTGLAALAFGAALVVTSRTRRESASV